jgi:hypothetical protein
MRFIEATEERAEFVAQRLRFSDCMEVLAAEGRSGYEGAMAAWRDSGIKEAIEGDQGDPVGLCGVNGNYIWMLGTDDLTSTESHRRQLVRGARRWISAVVEQKLRTEGQCLLCNWVCARNLESVRWLQSLGFTVDRPEPIGHSLQLFRYFEMVR